MTLAEHRGLPETEHEAPAEHAEQAAASRARPAVSLSRYSGLGIWAGFIVLFALWVPDTFLTKLTAQGIVADQAVTAIIAIGLLAPLAAGAFDLSIGSMVGLSAIVVAALTARAGVPLAPAIVITFALGLLVGAVNGFLVVHVGISSLIATLAMSSVLVAPARAVSGDQIVSGVPASLTDLTTGRPLGVPVIAIYTLAIAIVAWYVLEHTPLGRRLAATGAGAEAARLAGVRTKRMVFGALMTSSTLATAAGILLASKLSTATPDIGPVYLLPAFAAAFLGTTQIKPGRFNVWGTLLAILLLATGAKGLQLAGAAAWVTDLFNGVALVLAVGLSLWGPRLAMLRTVVRRKTIRPAPAG